MRAFFNQVSRWFELRRLRRAQTFLPLTAERAWIVIRQERSE